MPFTPTRRLVYLAVLISLNIILTRIASINIPFEGVVTLRVGFGTLPIILAGLLFGPGLGAAAGILGDLIGFQLNPMGPYIPLLTFVAALHGFLPPLLFRLTGYHESILSLGSSIALTQVICSVILTPLILQASFGIPWYVTLPGRLLSQAVIVPMYYILLRKMLFALRLQFH